MIDGRRTSRWRERLRNVPQTRGGGATEVHGVPHRRGDAGHAGQWPTFPQPEALCLHHGKAPQRRTKTAVPEVATPAAGPKPPPLN